MRDKGGYETVHIWPIVASKALGHVMVMLRWVGWRRAWHPAVGATDAWQLAKGVQQRFRHPVRCGGNPSLIDVRQRAAQRRDAGAGVQEEGLRTPRSPTSTSQLPAVVCRITRGSEAAPIGTVLRTRRRPLEAPSPGGARITPTRRPYGRRSTTPSPLLAKYRGLH